MADFKKRTRLFENELSALCKKYKIRINFQLEFPQYKILPDEITLALRIVDKNDAQPKIIYLDVVKETEDKNASK